MKSFNNNIENSIEKKIKKSPNLPPGAVNLAYFSAEDISPSNTTAVVDASLTIKENYVQAENTQLSLIANELGMLEDPITGNNRFSSENIQVTDVMNSFPNKTEFVNVPGLNSKPFGELSRTDYFYSYYVSRYFTVQDNIKSSSIDSFTYAGKNIFDIVRASESQKFILEDNKVDISDIYVTYSDGSPYVDESGKNKYKVVLEKYTQKYVSEIESLCRIIVLLEDANPPSLLLNYNKIELTIEGSLVNSISNYSEPINSVLLFKQESEESIVVDYSSKHDKTYAVKDAQSVENKFSVGGIFDSRGYNFYVNKKAMPDNRNYEIFNWRIIGKIQRSFNYANRLSDSENGGIVNVGVISIRKKRLQ